MCSTTMSNDIKRAIMEGVGHSEEAYRKHFSGRSTHIWRHICAVRTSFGGAPAQEGNRAGLWADKTVGRRELIISTRIYLSLSREPQLVLLAAPTQGLGRGT